MKKEDTENELLVEEESVEESIKSILVSKTFWTNVVALLAFLIQSKWGFVIDETIQVQLLAVVNIWLRAITKEPVRWKKESKQ
ncbi:MAG: hypothetical protein ACXW2E_00470 [Nitrososphaeraceae archaeon]